jgi:starvation-inducible DNA-binding protein
MSQTDQPPFLYYATRIDIPLEIRAYLITLLNQTLACTMDLRSQVKHAAWNVKGTAFVQLRALFDALASDLEAHTDLMAARIAVLGGVVQGTVRTAAMQSTLLEYPGDITESDAHVRALAERVAHYARELRADITHAADVEDADTANVYTDLSRGIDQRLSFLEAHLHP